MTKHFHEEMPLYVAGQMKAEERALLEQHMADCPACRAELDFWRELSSEIQAGNQRLHAPASAVEKALVRIHAESDITASAALPGWRMGILYVANLLRAQAYLVKREMWPASASIMALGVVVALVSNHVEAITALVPLVAAASLAMLFSPEYDAAYELVLSTPTTPWKILLARLSVVSAFNLALALLASAAMLFIIPADLLGMLILGWLAPMAFLSSLALLLSMWLSSGRAILLSYGLWLLQFRQVAAFLSSHGFSTAWDAFLAAYAEFWQSSGELLLFSAFLLLLALISTRFAGRRLPQIAA